MAVRVDSKLWYPSNYARLERKRKRCPLCGLRVRGPNHEQGEDCKRVSAGRRTR